MSNKASSSKVLINSIIYTISGLFIKCINFFLIPLYTAHMSAADYGITGIGTSFINTLSFVFAFSLYSAIMRFYVDLKNDSTKLKRFYGTVVVFTLISSLVFCGIIIALKEPVSKHIFAGVDFIPIIAICIATTIFMCQYTIYENILRSQQKALKCSILSVCYFIVVIVCNIYFVVYNELGAVGVLLSSLIGGMVYTIVFWIDMIRTRSMTICIDFNLLKEALKYSVPIMPHNLSTQIAELVSKALVGGTASLGAVGVFTVATQFGTVADTVQIYVNNAYGPWLYEKLHDREDGYKQTIRNISRVLSAIIGLFFIGISLFAHDYVVLFVSKDFHEAWKYIPLVVLVYAIKTTYWFYINILFYYKKAAKMLFVATLTGSIVNVLLSYFFIPVWGVYGSIAADMIGMLIRVSIVVFISRRFEDVGLHLYDFLFNLIIVVVFIVSGLSLSFIKYGNTFSWINFAFKIFIVLSYIAIISLMYRKQAKTLLDFLNKKRTTMMEDRND